MFTTPIALTGQPHAFLVDGLLSVKLLTHVNFNFCIIHVNVLGDLQVCKILYTYYKPKPVRQQDEFLRML